MTASLMSESRSNGFPGAEAQATGRCGVSEPGVSATCLGPQETVTVKGGDPDG